MTEPVFEYIPRLADIELRENLEAFGAVVITGPKWCGKTTTAKRMSRSQVFLQDEDRREEYRRILDVRPSMLLEGDKPRLIDEWQTAPELWNAVRKSVDDLNSEGLYIMTGSTSVERREEDHSGTGRIVEMRMRTMSLYESGRSAGEVSLGDLFVKDEVEGHSDLRLEDIAECIVRGGWPRTMDKSMRVAHRQMAGYCESILNTSVPSDEDRGKEVSRDPERMRQILRSLSRNESAAAPDTKILSDVVAKGNASMSMNTLRDYLAALRRIYVIDDTPAWSPKLRSKATVRTSNTRHLCDPAVAAYFLGASINDLMGDLNTFGLLFESMAVRDLKVYAGALGAEVRHYRDSDGLEADAIIHMGHTGEWGAVEIKLGQGMVDSAAGNLLSIRDKVSTEPAFLAVVTGTEYAYTRDDGVHVIPLGCLRHRGRCARTAGRPGPHPPRGPSQELNLISPSSSLAASTGNPSGGSSTRDCSKRLTFPLCGSRYPVSLTRSSACRRTDLATAAISTLRVPSSVEEAICLAMFSCTALLSVSALTGATVSAGFGC